uniref:Peptidase M24 domain-containing protein n=1 Tax=Ganoderma boninense TaxID=34458 RepID=A0A5K1K3G7_9APHY
MQSAFRPAFAFFPLRLRTVSAHFFTTSRTPRLPRFFASMAAHATVNTSARLQALRELMEKPEYNVQAVVVPTEDQRKYLVSEAASGCAYFLQAEKQLDHNWTLMKQGLPNVPTWQEFLSKNLDSHTRIGVDPTLIAAADAEVIQKALEPKQSELVSLPKNLVDLVWSDRPSRPANTVSPLEVKFSGKSHTAKLELLREELKKKGARATVVNMLDEVAWLFNLRGSDIDFNPVFFAYGLIDAEKTLLFVNESQFDESVRNHLGSEIEVHPYDTFFAYLTHLGAELKQSKDNVLISDKASLAVADAIGKACLRVEKDNVIVARSPVTDLKAIKNDVEVEGFRQSHVRDGAALVRYFAWLEEQLDGGAVLNESQAADQLEKYRSENDLFKGLSFPTISATGPNGGMSASYLWASAVIDLSPMHIAIIHYQPDRDDCAVVKKEQIYLCDSGAQYLDGTTDVTRTYVRELS